jgi:hypothetical protein
VKPFVVPAVYLIVGLVLGAGLYRHFAPAKVEFKDREVTKVVEKEGKVEVREVAGPVRVETKTVVKTVPGPERPGPTVERVVTRVETRDPVTSGPPFGYRHGDGVQGEHGDAGEAARGSAGVDSGRGSPAPAGPGASD